MTNGKKDQPDAGFSSESDWPAARLHFMKR